MSRYSSLAINLSTDNMVCACACFYCPWPRPLELGENQRLLGSSARRRRQPVACRHRAWRCSEAGWSCSRIHVQWCWARRSSSPQQPATATWTRSQVNKHQPRRLRHYHLHTRNSYWCSRIVLYSSPILILNVCYVFGYCLTSCI